MGLFDLLKPGRKEVAQTRTALDAAHHAATGPADEGAIARLVQMLLDAGLDGAGPLGSAQELADEALREAGGDREAAIHAVARGSLVRGGVTGFVTGLGGFVTMPVALPANVAAFYVQATRMVGAVAALRGYDLADPRIRTAVLLTLVGSDADEVLRKAGMTTGGGRITAVVLKGLPPAALMVVNKAIGFRLMRGVGQKLLGRLGRGVPVAGGVVGGGLDAWMMKKIADQAMAEFPVAGGTGTPDQGRVRTSQARPTKGRTRGSQP